jgi:hypothetical protein
LLPPTVAPPRSPITFTEVLALVPVTTLVPPLKVVDPV